MWLESGNMPPPLPHLPLASSWFMMFLESLGVGVLSRPATTTTWSG